MTRQSKPIKKKLLRIRDIVRATGISSTTIHYYTRKGLISPAVKTARNMAYYDRECVDKVLLIKSLQEKKFFPLSVIKTILESKPEERDILTEMHSFLDEIFASVGQDNKNNVTRGVSLRELAGISGLSANTLKSLQHIGLLMPWDTRRGKSYDDIDVHIAKTVKTLEDFGVTSDDLTMFKQYVEVIRTEAQMLHNKVHSYQSTDKLSITKLVQTLFTLNEYLAVKICRKAILEFHK